MRVVISLGGAEIDDEARRGLVQPNVSVETCVDQWNLLQEADVFVTHHGMNSTHEAIFRRVPMISYPFFWDRPALAVKCQGFGVAVPLASFPRGVFGEAGVGAALAKVIGERGAMQTSLDRACTWERAALDGRAAVLERVIGLMG